MHILWPFWDAWKYPKDTSKFSLHFSNDFFFKKRTFFEKWEKQFFLKTFPLNFVWAFFEWTFSSENAVFFRQNFNLFKCPSHFQTKKHFFNFLIWEIMWNFIFGNKNMEKICLYHLKIYVSSYYAPHTHIYHKLFSQENTPIFIHFQSWIINNHFVIFSFFSQ